MAEIDPPQRTGLCGVSVLRGERFVANGIGHFSIQRVPVIHRQLGLVGRERERGFIFSAVVDIEFDIVLLCFFQLSHISAFTVNSHQVEPAVVCRVFVSNEVIIHFIQFAAEKCFIIIAYLANLI